MPWFKVDDKLHSHRKSARAGTAAMGLWVLAGSWCMEHLTDGFLPDSAARRLDPDARELGASLVAAGLWDTAQQDGEDGWQFRNWHEFQPTRETVLAQRQAARDRMARVRGKSPNNGSADVRANSAGSSDSPIPVPVVPTELDTTAGGGDFDAFWSEYPRKIGKAPAAKAYAKAIKSTDPERILAGLRNAVAVWSASRTEDRFIPHASTWLNAGRWEDEQPVLPGTPAQAGPSRPSKTLAQCDGTDCPGIQHEWTDRRGRNAFVCMGVTA